MITLNNRIKDNNKSKELAKNTIVVSAGRLSTQLLGYLLLPLYTSALSKEEYGIVDLVNVYSQLLVPIVILQVDQALMRFMIKDGDSESRRIRTVSSTYFFYIFQVIAFAFLSLGLCGVFRNNIIIFLYVNTIAIGFSNLTLQTVRGLGDNLTYSIASFICGVITVLLNVVFIAELNLGAEGMILASIIGNLISVCYVFYKKKIYKFIKISSFNCDILKNVLHYSWPLVPNSIIWWIVNASDRGIVQVFLGTEANGILAISHKFSAIIIALYNLFHITWTESAMRHFSEKDKNSFFSSVFDTVFRVMIAFSILLIGTMPFIFGLLINPSFTEAYYQIPIYTAASMLNVIAGVFSVIYVYEMKTREIAKTSLVSGGINILINILFIEHIGLYAASISSVVAFGVMAFYRAADVKKYITYRISVVVVIASVLMYGVGGVSFYMNNQLIHIIYLLVAMAYGLLINKRNIKLVVAFLKAGRNV